MKQLCWDCKNTNANDCIWFRKHKLPKGCITNAQGFICECPNFQRIESLKKRPTYTVIARELGISERVFYRNKTTYMEMWEKLQKEKTKK